MYYIDHRYGPVTKNNLYETYEEALTKAQEYASKDHDQMDYYVNEIKSVVKAEPVAHPVKTLVITDETQHLLTQDKSDDSKSERAFSSEEHCNAAPLQAAVASSQDEVQSEGS